MPENINCVHNETCSGNVARIKYQGKLMKKKPLTLPMGEECFFDTCLYYQVDRRKKEKRK